MSKGERTTDSAGKPDPDAGMGMGMGMDADGALPLAGLADDMLLDPVYELSGAEPVPGARRPPRKLPLMMRKIPVTLTLEVGAVCISLHELMALGPDSVLELDVAAGEPLVIKVNGTPIGRAEVVVSGDNYGLKVIDLDGLDLDLGLDVDLAPALLAP